MSDTGQFAPSGLKNMTPAAQGVTVEILKSNMLQFKNIILCKTLRFFRALDWVQNHEISI